MRLPISSTTALALVVLAAGCADKEPTVAAPNADIESLDHGSAVLVVDDDGMAEEGDCDASTRAISTIQEAVDAAASGSVVHVCPGPYPEQVMVEKSLSFEGPQAGVDPRFGEREGSREARVYAIEFTGFADGSIDGFIIGREGPREFGNVIFGSGGPFKLSNSIVENSTDGVRKEGPGSVTIEKSLIQQNNTGIMADDVTELTLTNVTLSHNNTGVQLSNASNTRVADSDLEGNQVGISGRQIADLVIESTRFRRNGIAALELFDAKEVRVVENTMTDNRVAMSLSDVTNSTAEDISITGGDVGVQTTRGRDLKFEGNEFRNVTLAYVMDGSSEVLMVGETYDNAPIRLRDVRDAKFVNFAGVWPSGTFFSCNQCIRVEFRDGNVRLTQPADAALFEFLAGGAGEPSHAVTIEDIRAEGNETFTALLAQPGSLTESDIRDHEFGHGQIEIGPDNSGNEIRDNLFHDAFDRTTGDGTAGTANTWVGNKCTGTASPEGICEPVRIHPPCPPLPPRDCPDDDCEPRGCPGEGCPPPEPECPADEEEGEEEGIEVELEGVIETIAPPMLQVAGRTVLTDRDTKIERGGERITLADLRVGEEVEVEGILQADASVLAREIQVEDADAAEDRPEGGH